VSPRVLAGGLLGLLCAWGAPALHAAADADWAIEVPGRLLYVSAASGSDAGPGTRAKPFRTISQAAALAMPGDAVLVDAGVYHERVAPPRGGTSAKPIIYKGRPGLQAVITGADRWDPAWTPLKAGSAVRWAVPDGKLFSDDCYTTPANPFRVAMARTPGGRDGRPEADLGLRGADRSLVYTLGQVFLDGEALLQVASLGELERSASGWWYEAGTGRLHVRFPDGIDPAAHAVEISTRRRVFAPHVRGLGHIQVIGFVIQRCGNQFPGRFWESPDNVQAGALGTRAGHHWVIRGNLVRQANTIGMDIGGEGLPDGERQGQQCPLIDAIGDHLVEGNWVLDNGVAGISGCHTNRTVIRGNVIGRNNTLRFFGPERYEQAGIKLHSASRALIERNLVYDNHDYGIYLDSGGSYEGTRITRNVVAGNLAAGMHIEQSNMPADSLLIDTNVVIGCGGAGIFLSGASGVTIAQNLLAGSRPYDFFHGTGVYVHLSETFGGRSDTGRVCICGNLVVDNTAPMDLNYPTALAASRSLDGNVYGGASAAGRTFQINPYAAEPRISDAALAASIHHDLGGVSPGLNTLAKAWRVPLTFAEWQAFWGHHLQAHDGGSRIDPAARAVRVGAGDDVRVDLGVDDGGLTVARHAGLTTDFTGQALPAGRLRPGPWQGRPAGISRLDCWSGIPIEPPLPPGGPSSPAKPGGPGNTPPTITAIADQQLAVGRKAGPLPFTVGDAQTAAANLAVSAVSSNAVLVPSAAIAVGGSGAARTLTVTPGPGRTGTATISVSVSDGTLSSTRSFVVQVDKPAGGPDIVINFQPEGSQVPLHNLPDYGRTFGDRGNGHSYGWSVDARTATRERNSAASPDQRHDTMINFPAGQDWELALPNGRYDVRLICGDPWYDPGRYQFLLEGTKVVDGVPTRAAKWLDVTYGIDVNDGRLTLTEGSMAQLGRLCVIEVTRR
jgi:parallel beta-helix repeat protein